MYIFLINPFNSEKGKNLPIVCFAEKKISHLRGTDFINDKPFAFDNFIK